MDANLTKPSSYEVLPSGWRVVLEREVASGEELVGFFTPNLNSQLAFDEGIVAITNRRILSVDLKLRTGPESQNTTSWTHSECKEFRVSDKNGLGTLELFGHNSRLHVWRFTASGLGDARRLRDCFESVLRGASIKANTESEIATAICPSCGVSMPAGELVCVSCAAQPALPTTKSLWRLTNFARPHAGILLVGFLLTLASVAASIVPIKLSGWLTDEVNKLSQTTTTTESNFALVQWYLLALFAAALITWLLSWTKTYYLAMASEKISADLRNQSYGHLQRLSLEFFGGKRTGDLISRVSDDAQRICDFLSIQLVDFTTDLVMIVLFGSMLFFTNPLMALVTLLPFPIIAWLVQRIQARMRHGFARGLAAWAEMVNVLADTIPGIRVVKAFAQEHRETERFSARNQLILEANNRVNRLWAAFAPAITFMTDCGLLIVWGFGAYRVAGGSMKIGDLVFFIVGITRLFARLESMSRMLAQTQRAAAATNRIFEILDRVPSVAEPVKPIHPGRVRGEIELRNMSFRYGSRQVLHNLNLHIRPGEMIGLVGPSGSGKSTLVNLVCRFYDAHEGAVFVDGRDVRSYPVTEYRSNIGIVLQEPFLFFGSIADNIAYGRPDATRQEIIASARASRAHEFILRLADGYDSMVGERGQSLSGGERQRISIARALLTDPRILILDEATSSVDTETERDIQEALDHLTLGRTTIAIAHRISTLRKADRIVVLESGRITEIGTHDDLLIRQGTYYRLHQAQQQMVQESIYP